MSKYKAKRIETPDGTFDSKKELKRWEELKRMQSEGTIKDLRRQVVYTLIPSQKIESKVVERACTYKADFVYTFMGSEIVEDVKGYRHGTAYNIFVIKRKLMLWVHGIRVVEV